MNSKKHDRKTTNEVVNVTTNSLKGTYFFIALAFFFAGWAAAGAYTKMMGDTPKDVKETTKIADIDRGSYAMGVVVHGLIDRALPVINVKDLKRGLDDKIAGGDMLLTDKEIKKSIEDLKIKVVALEKEQKSKKWASWKKENEDFLIKNSSKTGIKTTKSGIQYKIEKIGSGVAGNKAKSAIIKYKVSYIDNTIIDQSKDGVEISTKAILAGVKEGINLIKEGGKIKLWIPEDLAYGENSEPRVKPYSTVIFEVELAEVREK